MLSRLMFAIVDRQARKGLAESRAADESSRKPPPKNAQARRTGVRGETYAYWYLRRHGYIVVARNYMRPGIKGEIDMVGYDGPVLAFVEVKTRAAQAIAIRRSARRRRERRQAPLSSPHGAPIPPRPPHRLALRIASTCSPSKPAPARAPKSACTREPSRPNPR